MIQNVMTRWWKEDDDPRFLIAFVWSDSRADTISFPYYYTKENLMLACFLKKDTLSRYGAQNTTRTNKWSHTCEWPSVCEWMFSFLTFPPPTPCWFFIFLTTPTVEWLWLLSHHSPTPCVNHHLPILYNAFIRSVFFSYLPFDNEPLKIKYSKYRRP